MADMMQETTLRQRYQRLFMFDLWSTRSLVKMIEEGPDFSDRVACLAFLSHIVTVQEIWMRRILREPWQDGEDEPDPWAEYKPPQLRKKAAAIHQRWIDLIGDEEIDLETELTLPRPDGSITRMALRQVLEHLIVHGQHHRAQIGLFLRKSGVEAPVNDYFSYTRQEGLPLGL